MGRSGKKDEHPGSSAVEAEYQHRGIEPGETLPDLHPGRLPTGEMVIEENALLPPERGGDLFGVYIVAGTAVSSWNGRGCEPVIRVEEDQLAGFNHGQGRAVPLPPKGRRGNRILHMTGVWGKDTGGDEREDAAFLPGGGGERIEQGRVAGAVSLRLFQVAGAVSATLPVRRTVPDHPQTEGRAGECPQETIFTEITDVSREPGLHDQGTVQTSPLHPDSRRRFSSWMMGTRSPGTPVSSV